MNINTTDYNIILLEKELDQIAPLVHKSFSLLGGPAPHIEAAIRAEACRQIAHHHHFLSWSTRRILAVAASFMLLIGGATHLHLTRLKNSDKKIENFASLLLDIQGLNEECYFSTNEAEFLWL